ncbi:MAG: undecaprenyl-phosphate 4-deoxy-4-formamido-L-arabinose transferase [Phycisphaerae bacterium]|nr:undecaprenyl-phosphate 4-deoxy-4-formamido-L-arabinose transferase [Phycisphaerae bacterium]|tara:strand:- start:5016 stop:6017 length:1002 start_codon:yes stop_codon:yes gene_type:complete
MKSSVSIVIPVYNEIENLDELIDRCEKVGGSLDRPWELVLVDDGSRDGSSERLVTAAHANPDHIKAVLLNRNYGQHNAVICGFSNATGDVVVTLDADLQNPPEEIPNLLSQIDQGSDVVGTVRVNRQDSPFRKLASWMINHLVKKTTGVMMHDYGCMLRAYRRNIVEAMLQCRERSTFIPVLANSFAKRTSEIEVSHAERSAGTSKYGFMRLINLQFDLLTCMTTFPLRLLTWVGVIISAGSVAFGGVLLVLRLALGPEWAAAGVFTLFSVLFFLVGIQFVAMGLLGEYLSRVHNDVRGRPRYFVDSVHDQTVMAEESAAAKSDTTKRRLVHS